MNGNWQRATDLATARGNGPRSLSPTQRLLADALKLQAKRNRLDAAGRQWTGPQHADYRKFLREEAARCDRLRTAIITADDLALDMAIGLR
jgi:hypothetical protein